jgi:hypothetical protein
MRIKVKDFSTTPGARYRIDGDFSGQEFYEDHLQKAFEISIGKKEKLIIELDGTEGYATSFLDEAFGRLAEEYGPKQTINNIEIISNEEPDWIDEINSYILERNEIK